MFCFLCSENCEPFVLTSCFCLFPKFCSQLQNSAFVWPPNFPTDSKLVRVHLKYSDPTPCKILSWGGLGGEEWGWRDPAKIFASKFSDWLDRVLGRRHKFCFGQCRIRILKRPMRHSVQDSKFSFQAVVRFPKFWVKRVSTVDDWCTWNLCSF